MNKEEDYSIYLQNVEEIRKKKTEWIIPNWIPRGGITLLVGDGGIGKTNLWSCLISDLSNGMPTLLETDNAVRPGHFGTYYVSEDRKSGALSVKTTPAEPCLYFSKEDSTAKQLKTNFELYGACMANIHTIDIEHLTGFHYHSESLEKMIDSLRPGIVVFDPIQAFFPAGSSMTSRQQTRKVLDRLVLLGQEYNTAFLLVCHTNKKGTDDWRQRISGSADLPDIARSIIFSSYTEYMPKHTVRFISNEKNSYAELQDTVLYQFDENGTILYMGISDKRFADYARQKPYEGKPEEKKTQKEQCMELILRILEEKGEIRISELNGILKEAGFRVKTCSSAKTELENNGMIERLRSAENVWTARLRGAEGVLIDAVNMPREERT